MGTWVSHNESKVVGTVPLQSHWRVPFLAATFSWIHCNRVCAWPQFWMRNVPVCKMSCIQGQERAFSGCSALSNSVSCWAIRLLFETPHSGSVAGLWAFEFLRSTTEYCRTREGAGNSKVIGNGRNWLSISDQDILTGGIGSKSVWINLTWVIGSGVVDFFYPQHLSMKAGSGVWPSLSVEFPRLERS